MVNHYYPSRFDFDYWPPRPVEQPDDEPRRINPDDIVRLNDNSLYIHDGNRRAQVRRIYSSGDYADIEDFWLASNPPRPSVLRRASLTENEDYKIHRNYLKNASSAFKKIVYALDGTRHNGFGYERGDNAGFLDEVFCDHERDERYMNHIPPVYLDKRNILVARKALEQCFDRDNPLVHFILLPASNAPSKRVSALSLGERALIKRVQEDNKTYKDSLFPDTIPDWL